MAADFIHAVFRFHDGLEPALHLLGFAAQHRGLVGHAKCLQMQVRIKAGGIGTFKFFQEFVLVAAVQNVVTDIIRFPQVEDHEIMSAAVGAGL